MRSALKLGFAVCLALLPASCILVKETVPVESPENLALRDRVARLEALLDARGDTDPAAKRFADAAVGEVTAISASGGLLMLRLRPGHAVAVGARLAIVGAQGFRGLVKVEEVFEETSVSARALDPVPSTAEVGDRVLTAN